MSDPPAGAAAPGGAVARAADGLLVAFVAGVAAWTVCYHAALVLGWSVDATLALWAGLLAVAGFAALRRRIGGRPRSSVPANPAEDVVPAPRPAAVLAGVAAGAALATGLVLDEPAWYGFWVAGLVVSAGAALLAVRARRAVPRGGRAPEGAAGAARPAGAAGAVVVVLAAIAFAVLSVVTVRPDADDVFLLNRANWVEERGGPFPERDTLFSDEVFRANRPEWPSPAVEPLVGAIARLLPVRAPSVAYLGFAPATAALGVLALWRLLRTLRAPAPALACLAGAGFLALDGAYHTTFGNFSFARAWQGKVPFLIVVVPLLWHWALRWSRDGDRRALAALALANVAGVGLTSTALLVAPPVTLLGAAAGLRRGRSGRVLAAVAALAYPLAAGAVAAASGGPDRAALRPFTVLLALGRGAQVGAPAPLGGVGGLDPADPWYTAFGQGPALVVATAAVLLAWLGTRDRTARIALAVVPGAVLAALCSPGALHLLDGVTGASSILWRVMWVLPVPAAVGLVATAPLLLPRGVPRAVLAVAVPATAAVVLLTAGTPVWSEENGTTVGAPAWDVAAGDRDAAERLLELTERGDVVMAPESVGGALAVITVDVRAVNPRARYVDGRTKRAFRSAERLLLSRAAAGGIPAEEAGAVGDALAVLGVDAACVRPGLAAGGDPVAHALLAAGFEPAGAADDECAYYRFKG